MFTSPLSALFWIFLNGNPAAPTTAPVAGKTHAKPVAVRVAAAPTAAEVVTNVQTFYKDIKQVTAKFRQQVTNVTFGDTKTSDGMVWISSPGKMRWDYYSKPKKGKVSTKKSFISNGTYLYVVEHDNKQVIKKNLEKDLMPVAVSFLYGKGDLAADFDAKLDTSGKYGEKTDYVLELTPKKASTQYKTLYLVADPSNWRVKQSVIIDSADNVNHFRFFTPDFDKAVEAKWFEFDPASVPSYRVVDADQQTGSAAATGSGAAGSATDPGKATPTTPKTK
jgi:outer membrane lipoprotein carrier protein